MDDIFPYAFRYTVVDANIFGISHDDVRVTDPRIPYGCLFLNELEIISNKPNLSNLDLCIWLERPFFETVTYKIKIPETAKRQFNLIKPDFIPAEKEDAW